MSSAKAAAGYISRGLAPVPIPPGRKGPNLPDWQDLRVRLEEVPRYFANGQNVGVLTGEPSGWRVDVDIDVSEAATVAGRFLPPTLTSGRERAPHSHWWYLCPGARTEKWRDLDGTMLVELRSTGCQTVVAPSVHPEGDRYVWHEGLEMAEISAGELAEGCRDLAAAALIARHLPPVGGRHDFALALVGYLLRRLDDDKVRRVVHAAWDAAGGADRDAHRDLDGIVADTAEKLAAGEHVVGGPRLEEAAAGVPRLLARWYGWASATVAEVGGGPPSANGYGHAEPPARYNLTDLGNAERFVARYGEGVRYCYPWGKWLVWTGARWERDDAGRVHRLAKEAVRGIYAEAAAAEDEERRKALARHATRSEAEGRIKAMLELAKSEVPVSPDDLDADPWLLNAPNGTVDLRTGALRPHRREDLLTKMAGTAYDPDAAAPTWGAFLERVLPGAELRGFVKRAAGYSATGDTSEQCMFINHGSGNNGKSTFQEALAEALGDYAMRAPTEMLMAKRSGGVPNDVARLKGARFVASSETEEGRRLAESLVKDLTGQDTISARFMRAEWFDFKPTHKLWLSTNHKPEIRGTDNAIWRRIRLIPWALTIPPAERDRKLPERLRAELPGVLAWAVAGCLEWEREGLRVPEEVRQATREYRAEMDVLAAFLEDCCERAEQKSASAGELWDAWKRWCEETGEKAETQKRFGGRLSERGFLNDRDSRTGRKVWFGLALRPDWEARAGVGLNHPTGRFAGKTEQAEPSEPKMHINASKTGPRGDMREKGSDGSDSSGIPATGAITPALSGEGEAWIRRRVGEGMDERRARAEALRQPRYHALDCPCEDCS